VPAIKSKNNIAKVIKKVDYTMDPMIKGIGKIVKNKNNLMGKNL